MDGVHALTGLLVLHVCSSCSGTLSSLEEVVLKMGSFLLRLL